MSRLLQMVEFALDGHNYAVSLAAVERIVNVVEVAPLPKSPQIVLGVINFSGRIIPVVDMRRRFRLFPKEVGLYDHMIVAKTSKREIAFIVDDVSGVIDCPEANITAAEEIVPGLEYLAGVLKLNNGLIFIHDLERFLSLDEERSLYEAMQGL